MKGTAILLLTASMQVSAAGFSQTVNLHLRQAPLEKVFTEIERQTGFNFYYQVELLRQAPKLTISLHDAGIGQALDSCLSGLPLTYEIIGKMIVLKPRSPGNRRQEPAPSTPEPSPPPVTVTGHITDEKGAPMSGVTVLVKGTRTGTVSDADGNFTLQIPDPGSTLVLSHVGYLDSEVPLRGRTTLAIGMKVANTSLNQVVIVGYGTVKKGDLTGSVTKIDGGDVQSAPVASVDQALQGKAAGVQVTSISGAPGAGTTIRIRGGNSINASNEPLYVVDGFIGGGDLTSINVADIESIEILKDASATAIYGARGANGVILITTKHGRAGTAEITANVYTGFQELPKEVSLLTGPQLAQYVNERAALFNSAPVYPDVSKVTNTDWQKVITRHAGMVNANLGFSGGTEKVTYYLSGNYFNQDGIILNSGFQRYQTRLNLRLKLAPWLTFGTDMNFSRSKFNNNKTSLYDILKTAPTSLPVKDSTGNYTILSPLSGQVFENPVATALESINNSYATALLGGWYLEASFHNGLRFRSTFDIDADDSTNEQYAPGTLPLNLAENIGGSAQLSALQSFNWQNENTVSYTRDFGKHHVDLVGGFTYQHEVDKFFQAKGAGFTNDDLTFNNLSTGNPLQASNSSNYSAWTIASLLGRANYSFEDKYLLTVSARQDGSSRLAANHKYAFFPSAAVAWKLGNEQFIRDLHWFSDLKLRASYGKTGNQAIAVYSTLPSLQVTNVWFNGQQQLGYTLGNIPNSDLKWETTNQADIGLDAGFFKGRLTLDADAYYKKTYNLLLNVPIAGTTGYSSRLANVGSTRNAGVELLVSGTVIQQRDFAWTLSFNIAGNRNKVLALGAGKQFIDIADGYRLIVGKPAPVFWGAKAEGVFHTQEEVNALPGYQASLVPGDIKFRDVNGNGKYDGAADDTIIGNPAPKYFGGFSSLFRYKRLTLNIYFEYSHGNDVINSLGTRWFAGDYASNVGAIATGRWEPSNTTSNIPRAGADARINVNSQAYSFAVQNGSFLRLKTLQLSYNLSPRNLKWMHDASLFFTASNLWIHDHYTWGYDPEVSTNGTSPVLAGGDQASYPQNRSFLFGINLKF
ncbi:MAG TPA: TonB-dependent receptor [Dinghuibacter sp.]|uniref:TonB-dependent receptor n=1 Tax=Dinghuibacter sp. TaxID=2024697 RepID=UPI002B5F9344|nr:TonB-dependent receptor [Dinghuibacter sp.]HTJ11817.1 TonB-dependent receptor [Dinghuibacter sp.]